MRILVLGAGGPAGVNTCRALNNCYEVFATDENPDHLVWCEPYAEITNDPMHWFDLVIPQPDRAVMWLADQATHSNVKTFLPDRRTIALCQDKFETGLAWRRAKLRDDRIELIDSREWPPKNYPCWLRARHGAGAKAAVNARTWHQANAWLTFWQERDRNLDFVSEEFLPGRDYAWSAIFKEGRPVMSFSRERLEYLYPGLTPEGLTGTPTIARIVHDDRVHAMAEAAVYAVDPEPHGFFSVDLREDENNIPRPTEINAGRVFTTFGLWAISAETNLFRYAFEDLDPVVDPLPAGLTMYRHIDCPAVFKTLVPA